MQDERFITKNQYATNKQERNGEYVHLHVKCYLFIKYIKDMMFAELGASSWEFFVSLQ